MIEMLYSHSFFPTCIGCKDGDYSLIICQRYEIEPMIIRGHYSHTMPKNSDLCIKMIYKGNHEGALSLGYGIRPEIKTAWGNIKKDEMREFDRMFITDIPPKNSESKVIGMLTKLLRKIRPSIKYLISYADGTVGNTGIIYRATNFKELSPIKADFYKLTDGTRVHPVTMWHRHKSRAWAKMQELYPGIEHITGNQYRFLLIIDRATKRKLSKTK